MSSGRRSGTRAFVLDGGALVLTPVVLGALAAVIAHGRRETPVAHATP